jgi:hypothetical protein
MGRTFLGGGGPHYSSVANAQQSTLNRHPCLCVRNHARKYDMIAFSTSWWPSEAEKALLTERFNRLIPRTEEVSHDIYQRLFDTPPFVASSPATSRVRRRSWRRCSPPPLTLSETPKGFPRPAGPVTFTVTGAPGWYEVSAVDSGGQKFGPARFASRYFSTEVAGGFTGMILGVWAKGKGSQARFTEARLSSPRLD